MTNPYQGLQDYRFWRRAVSNMELHRFDPVTSPRFQISSVDKVATAGSCFAQHISRKLKNIGFNYYVPENGEHLAEEVRSYGSYGVFSARFGNIYTAAQLCQLFGEAFDGRTLLETSWIRPDGKFADPYRSQIEPAGFDNVEQLLTDRQSHLQHVRTMFQKMDVFVFTLGLTEAWRSRTDGAVFPMAPGVVAGEFDTSKYEFVNFDVDDIYNQMCHFLDGMRAINSDCKVLLTVSPVPLIATYENRHVVVSTSYSKAALRVTAEMLIKKYNWVDYFPSFEIITSNFSSGSYYEGDFREVNSRGVAHAMRCFVNHYAEDVSVKSPATDSVQIHDASFANSLICDEEAIGSIRSL